LRNLEIQVQILTGSFHAILKIRDAKKEDLNRLYQLGLATLEFKTSQHSIFMDREELAAVIKSKRSVVVVAEDGKKLD